MRRFRSVPTLVQWTIGLIAVAVLSGGSAAAAVRITGRDVVNHSLTGRDIARSSLTGADIRNRSLTARDFRGSLRGPQGPAGPTGPAGAPGRNGFTLLDAHSSVVSVPGGSTGVGTTLCRPGETSVSGGYSPNDANQPLSYIPVLSGAAETTSHQQGWSVAVLNYGNDTTTLKVFAYCAVQNPPSTAARARIASRWNKQARSIAAP